MIKELVDNKLLEEQELKSKRIRSGKWSPSSLGRCYRYQFWNRKNEPQTNPPNAEVLRRFKMGNLIHDFIQKYFDKTERKVEMEDLVGFIDIELLEEVVDIKSVRLYAYKKMCGKDYDVKTDKFDNILQLMTYVWLSGKEKGRLVFIEKDALEIKEFVFELKDWIDKVKEELEILRGFWSQDKLPPAVARAYGGNECKYCGFKDKCDEIERIF